MSSALACRVESININTFDIALYSENGISSSKSEELISHKHHSVPKLLYMDDAGSETSLTEKSYDLAGSPEIEHETNHVNHENNHVVGALYGSGCVRLFYYLQFQKYYSKM